MLEALAASMKLVLYVGVLAGAGSAFAAASLRPVRLSRFRWIARIGGGLIIIGASAWITVLLDQLGGITEPAAIAAVASGPVGLAAGLQGAGGLLLIVFGASSGFGMIASLLGGGLAVASFGFNGHAAASGAGQGWVALVHVGAASWWLGSLFLLLMASRHLPQAEFSRLVQTFSRQALMVVALLATAGATLILTLLPASQRPWLSPYWQIITLKLAGVAALLSLAAFNKLRLTPRLAADGPKALIALRRSIAAEIAAFGLIAAITAILTTYTSPHA